MKEYSNKRRAYELYTLVESAPDKWWNQREVADFVQGYTYVLRNNDRCADIRNDMLYINSLPEFEKIIICKNYHYKIATREELKEYYNARIRRLKNQVKQIKDLEFKMKRNNHLDLITNEWWETYNEEDDDE